MSLADLTDGQSITDGCIGWEDSLTILENLAQGVRDRRVKIAQQAA
jgi:3-deoxy-7-phosphoheptulonate synthase